MAGIVETKAGELNEKNFSFHFHKKKIDHFNQFFAICPKRDAFSVFSGIQQFLSPKKE